MSMNRRHLLQASAAASAWPWLSWAAPSESAVQGRFVFLMLRGGFDGLHAFAPRESRLAELRPTLAQPLLTQGLPLGKTGFVAHPAAQTLADFFARGELTFAPCAGTVDSSRSHFQAQDLLELGTGAIRGPSGFLARAANLLSGSSTAVGFTQEMPLVLRGAEVQAEIIPLSGNGLKMPQGPLLDALRAAHAGQSTGVALDQALATQAELEMSQGMDPKAARGAAGVNGLPLTLTRMGQVLRRNRRLSISFLDIGGVDTHANEDNTLTRFLATLGEGLNAFKESLGPEEWARTKVVVLSEFGRTVKENGTRGTDHGHGGLCCIVGGALDSNTLLGGFDGLGTSNLNEGRDLPVRVDWRDLLAATMRTTIGYTERELDVIFPGRPRQSYKV